MPILRDKPAVGIAAAVVLLLVAAVLVFKPAPPRGDAGVYYYDLATAKRIAGSRTAPPDGMDPPVIANVFSCGACDGEQAFVGWLEEIGVDSADRRVAALPDAGATPQWVAVTSDEAAALMASVNEACDGDKAVLCTP